MESYSSEKTCDESQSSVKTNTKGTKSKNFKCRWLRSNRVSPDQLQPEVEGKTERKSKPKRFATSFAKGIRNLFRNVKKAYRSKIQFHLFVFCPVPIFLGACNFVCTSINIDTFISILFSNILYEIIIFKNIFNSEVKHSCFKKLSSNNIFFNYLSLIQSQNFNFSTLNVDELFKI